MAVALLGSKKSSADAMSTVLYSSLCIDCRVVIFFCFGRYLYKINCLMLCLSPQLQPLLCNVYPGYCGMELSKQVPDCLHSDYNAYVYWWMTWNGNGIMSTAGKPNKNGYLLSMFARWIRPGFYRVEATYHPQNGVYVVAFLRARRLMVLAQNTRDGVNLLFDQRWADAVGSSHSLLSSPIAN